MWHSCWRRTKLLCCLWGGWWWCENVAKIQGVWSGYYYYHHFHNHWDQNRQGELQPLKQKHQRRRETVAIQSSATTTTTSTTALLVQDSNCTDKIQLYDTNQDGRLQKDEYMKWIRLGMAGGEDCLATNAHFIDQLFTNFATCQDWKTTTTNNYNQNDATKSTSSSTLSSSSSAAAPPGAASALASFPITLEDDCAKEKGKPDSIALYNETTKTTITKPRTLSTRISSLCAVLIDAIAMGCSPTKTKKGSLFPFTSALVTKSTTITPTRISTMAPTANGQEQKSHENEVPTPIPSTRKGMPNYVIALIGLAGGLGAGLLYHFCFGPQHRKPASTVTQISTINTQQSTSADALATSSSERIETTGHPPQDVRRSILSQKKKRLSGTHIGTSSLFPSPPQTPSQSPSQSQRKQKSPSHNSIGSSSKGFKTNSFAGMVPTKRNSGNYNPYNEVAANGKFGRGGGTKNDESSQLSSAASAASASTSSESTQHLPRVIISSPQSNKSRLTGMKIAHQIDATGAIWEIPLTPAGKTTTTTTTTSDSPTNHRQSTNDYYRRMDSITKRLPFPLSSDLYDNDTSHGTHFGDDEEEDDDILSTTDHPRFHCQLPLMRKSFLQESSSPPPVTTDPAISPFAEYSMNDDLQIVVTPSNESNNYYYGGVYYGEDDEEDGARHENHHPNGVANGVGQNRSWEGSILGLHQDDENPPIPQAPVYNGVFYGSDDDEDDYDQNVPARRDDNDHTRLSPYRWRHLAEVKKNILDSPKKDFYFSGIQYASPPHDGGGNKLSARDTSLKSQQQGRGGGGGPSLDHHDHYQHHPHHLPYNGFDGNASLGDVSSITSRDSRMSFNSRDTIVSADEREWQRRLREDLLHPVTEESALDTTWLSSCNNSSPRASHSTAATKT